MPYWRSWPLPSLDGKKVPDGSWCPYCWHTEEIFRHGKTSAGTSRFRCMNPKCRRTFACWGKKKRVYTDIMKSNIILYRQLGSYGGIRATARATGVSTNTLYRRLLVYKDPVFPSPLKWYNQRFRDKSYPREDE